MTAKARRIDYSPDEMIAGVAGQMDPCDFGIYWMVCTLIYSKGEPIDDDHIWIARLFRGTHWRVVRASIDRLISCGKIEQDGGKLWVKRCAEELQKAGSRIAEASQNGRKGGRPANKNKDLEKADGLISEKLTINHQPSTPIIDAKASSSMQFEIWYQAYPHKVGRAHAQAAFPAALKRAGSLDALLQGIDRYKHSKPPDRSWCNPATWLRGDRWLDEPDLLRTTQNDQAKQADAGDSQALVNELLRRRQERQGGASMARSSGGNAGDVLPPVSG